MIKSKSITNNHDNGESMRHLLSVMGVVVALGIVFGDIGTSPLYVMKAIVGATGKTDVNYIIGGVSCIIWTLTLQTTVKYVSIALRADNKGEGGILALYSLIKKLRHKRLYIPAAIGASMLIADGVITPAVTVTSATEGLLPIWNDAPVMTITIVIISIIFFIQQFGTSKIGACFGPFMLAWFLMLGILGVMSIHDYSPVLKAFNPWYAVKLLFESPEWFLIMGAVFLCTTGAEALYSDLGHCGRMNISVSWIFVKAMLILNYLGQGAWIISAGSDAMTTNPFYSIMPSGFLPFGIAMSTGAAIIASQALISGSFTIFSEAMNLDLWPRLKIKYPTARRGQLFIPSVNILLYAGCVVTVLIFGTSSKMEAAYGLAITVTMLMTTVLMSFYLVHRGINRWIVYIFASVFICIEGVFFIANMFKFMHGGWYTLLIAGVLCFVMVTWHLAVRMRQRHIEYLPVSRYSAIITDIGRDRTIAKYASNLVYISHSVNPDMVESKILYSIINKSPKRADRYWFVRLEYVDGADTLEYTVKPLAGGMIWSVGLRLGFRVAPCVSVFLRQVIEDLESEGRVNIVSLYPSLQKHGIPGDFKFKIIHRIFSPTSNCSGFERTVMRIYDRIKRYGLSDETALGLDTSIVSVETVPLIINNRTGRRIRRAENPDQPKRTHHQKRVRNLSHETLKERTEKKGISAHGDMLT